MASKYNLPFSTLWRHVISGSSNKKLGRFKCVFTADQKFELGEYLKEMDSVFHELTREDFKSLAYEFASKNHIECPLNWKTNKKAGDEWLASFKTRHPEIVYITIARAYFSWESSRI